MKPCLQRVVKGQKFWDEVNQDSRPRCAVEDETNTTDHNEEHSFYYPISRVRAQYTASTPLQPSPPKEDKEALETKELKKEVVSKLQILDKKLNKFLRINETFFFWRNIDKIQNFI